MRVKGDCIDITTLVYKTCRARINLIAENPMFAAALAGLTAEEQECKAVSCVQSKVHFSSMGGSHCVFPVAVFAKYLRPSASCMANHP